MALLHCGEGHSVRPEDWGGREGVPGVGPPVISSPIHSQCSAERLLPTGHWGSRVSQTALVPGELMSGKEIDVKKSK